MFIQYTYITGVFLITVFTKMYLCYTRGVHMGSQPSGSVKFKSPLEKSCVRTVRTQDFYINVYVTYIYINKNVTYLYINVYVTYLYININVTYLYINV